MVAESHFMSNYFELFNLQPCYQLDSAELEAKYLQLQKQYHPDNFSSVSEQLQAVEKIVLINDAYQVLSNQVSLFEYYLAEKGIKLSEDEIKKNMSKDDLMFLLQIQKNNNIQELKEKTSSLTLSLIKSIEAQNNDDIKHYLAQLLFYNKSLKHI